METSLRSFSVDDQTDIARSGRSHSQATPKSCLAAWPAVLHVCVGAGGCTLTHAHRGRGGAGWHVPRAVACVLCVHVQVISTRHAGRGCLCGRCGVREAMIIVLNEMNIINRSGGPSKAGAGFKYGKRHTVHGSVSTSCVRIVCDPHPPTHTHTPTPPPARAPPRTAQLACPRPRPRGGGAQECDHPVRPADGPRVFLQQVRSPTWASKPRCPSRRRALSKVRATLAPVVDVCVGVWV